MARKTETTVTMTCDRCNLQTIRPTRDEFYGDDLPRNWGRLFMQNPHDYNRGPDEMEKMQKFDLCSACTEGAINFMQGAKVAGG